MYYSRWEDPQTSQEENPEDRYLCRTAKDGSMEEILREAASGDINVYNDKVYFTDWTTNVICRINTDGTEFEQLTEEYGTYINLAGDKLYYVVFDDDYVPTLKSISVD